MKRAQRLIEATKEAVAADGTLEEYFMMVLQDFEDVQVELDESDDGIHAICSIGAFKAIMTIGVNEEEKPVLRIEVESESYYTDLPVDIFEDEAISFDEMPTRFILDVVEKYKTSYAVLEAQFKKVIRAGKVVKKKIKRSKRRVILSSKQKNALKKARRKAHTGAAARKRKKSKVIRGRRNLK